MMRVRVTCIHLWGCSSLRHWSSCEWVIGSSMSCFCIMLLIVWSAHFISLAVVELQFYKLVYLFGYAHYIHLHVLAGQLVWPLDSIGTFETKCWHICLCLCNDHFDGYYYPTAQSIKTTKYINCQTISCANKGAIGFWHKNKSNPSTP